MGKANGYASQYGYELYDTTGTTEDWSYYADRRPRLHLRDRPERLPPALRGGGGRVRGHPRRRSIRSPSGGKAAATARPTYRPWRAPPTRRATRWSPAKRPPGAAPRGHPNKHFAHLARDPRGRHAAPPVSDRRRDALHAPRSRRRAASSGTSTPRRARTPRRTGGSSRSAPRRRRAQNSPAAPPPSGSRSRRARRQGPEGDRRRERHVRLRHLPVRLGRASRSPRGQQRLPGRGREARGHRPAARHL